MSSNLLKSSWVVVRKEDARVIDNNSLLEKKIGTVLHSAALPQEKSDENDFYDGLEAETVDALLNPEGAETVIKNGSKEERDILLQEIEQARAELSDLKAQADAMIENARAEIDNMQKQAYEDAKTQGYQEGERLGRKQADTVKEEYLARQNQLEQDYLKKIEELEPEFIENITGIYEHIFKVDLVCYQELVTGLLINAMQKTQDTKNFMIHVAKEDYEGVMANKDFIRAQAGGSNTSVEIIEDMTLVRSQCFIETENGIYDCSLDTELKELERKLKLLSYEKNK